MKNNNDISTVVLHSDVNRCIKNGTFPENMKNADITPTFKEGHRLLKSNYKPVNILPTTIKIYEKILNKITHISIPYFPSIHVASEQYAARSVIYD